jgi:hypothetical protein
VKVPGIREEDVQHTIVEGLRALGYTVLQTSRRGIRGVCPGCGTRIKSYGGDGADKGTPDLLVSKPGWLGAWIGLEVKSPTGVLRPEQRELAQRCMVFVVRSWEEALEAVQNRGGTM